MSLEIDDPETVAEVRAHYERYERALMDNDLEVMAELFSDGPDVVRFGIADRQRGAAALAAWRESRPPLDRGRTLSETTVNTFGRDVAVVSTLFSYPGRPMLGRQSQTWIRREGRWQIVHAHVSEIAAPR